MVKVQRPAVARAATPPMVNMATAELARRLCSDPLLLSCEQSEAVVLPPAPGQGGGWPGGVGIMVRRSAASVALLLARTTVVAPRAMPATVRKSPPRMIQGRAASKPLNAASADALETLSERRTIWEVPAGISTSSVTGS